MKDTKELSCYNYIHVRINKDGVLTERVVLLVKKTWNKGRYVVTTG
jgi:hypothetical protein